MGFQVPFVYADWQAQFPEFSANVNQAQATAYFTQATVYCRNDGGGPVPSAALQTQLLYLLTAHIAQLFAAAANGTPSPQVVGRVESATEGSVSVNLDYKAAENPNASWFTQTKYGAAYWQAIAPFRTMRYVPRNTPLGNPFAGPVWGGVGSFGRRFGG